MLPTEAYPSQRKGDEAEGEGDTRKALLPADGNLDDVYKEVLKIQPGSPHDGTCLQFTCRIIVHAFILCLRIRLLFVNVIDLKCRPLACAITDGCDAAKYGSCIILVLLHCCTVKKTKNMKMKKKMMKRMMRMRMRMKMMLLTLTLTMMNTVKATMLMN